MADEPAEDLIPLAQVKAHLKVEHDEDDDLIRDKLATAIDSLDGRHGSLGCSVRPRALVHRMHGFCSGAIRLPYPPIISVETIEVRAADGSWSAFPATNWELEDDLLLPLPGRSWPLPGVPDRGVRISYTAGYEPLPRPIRSAILLMTEDLYRNRGTTTSGTKTKVPMSTTVERMLEPFQVYS